jgi:hypothetical protein
MAQQAMFDAPAHELVWSAQFSQVPRSSRAMYRAAGKATRDKCEECTWYVHEHKGVGPSIGTVRVIRSLDGRTIRLCAAHAQGWRLRDGK